MSDVRAPRRTEAKEPFNAAEPDHVHAREKTAKDAERRRVAGLKLLLDHEDGRLWLWDLLGFCGVYRSSFTGNSETFYREGGRNVGLKIQAELTKHYPESLVQMMREGQDA